MSYLKLIAFITCLIGMYAFNLSNAASIKTSNLKTSEKLDSGTEVC